MNTIPGTIRHIEVADRLSMITVSTGADDIHAIVIDTPESADYLRAGTLVKALVKETEIIIALDGECNVSIQNKLKCKLLGIERGVLLSRLKLKFGAIEINSIVPTRAVDQLRLQDGQDVTALVKVNEVMLLHD